VSCELPPDAFLSARLAGSVEAELHWSGAELQCDGMRRPDGRGMRVTFSGAFGGGRLTLVFGIPRLAEGAAGHAVPVNVTLIREGGALYGTRGEDKCLLDDVSQAPLEAPPATVDPAAAEPVAARRWRIDARGFCLEPARSIAGGGDAILLARFDFRGLLTWQPDSPGETRPASPAAAASPSSSPQ
jgi:hypothetical protein